MQVLIGGLLGYAVGIAAWIAARRFVAHYRAQSVPDGQSQAVHLLGETRGAISPLGALTQAGLALWGAYVWWRTPALEQMLPALVVTGLLVTISLVDFQVRRIPNALVLALLLWALVQALWLGQPTPVAAGLGLLAGGGLLFLIALAGRGAMGAGDVKLAAALGAVLGYPLILGALFFGVLAAGAGALVLLATRRAGRKDYMAYGPYLALGGWIIWTRSLGIWP